MYEDWKAAIAKIVYWKQITNENDKLGAFPWHFPAVAADKESVAEAEMYMGVPFSADYREFLYVADGWRGFCVSTDLFGTKDFLNNRARDVRNRDDVKDYLLSIEIDQMGAIPIGSSDVDIDVFLLISESSSKVPGQVLWLAGTEIDRYPNFRQFFEAMINYNARLANQLMTQR